MRQDYSRTAEGMAMLRALEQRQPRSKRIIEDHYAAAFLQNPLYRWLAVAPLSGHAVSFLLKFWAPGGQEFLSIRPRLVDELVTAAATQGLEQVVILGAGFDTMAWRIRDVLSNVTVYEVDHPATQAVKRRVSERIGAPSNLRFVAVDFEVDDFVENLRAAGFDPQRRSFIVWVGVTYYLTAQAMARALQQIATLGGAGTQLVFDYMLAEVVESRTRNLEALDKGRRAAKLGEPWLFGLEPAQVGAYLAQFGFRLEKDYDAAELRARYCPQRQMPMSYVRIAVCERVDV